MLFLWHWVGGWISTYLVSFMFSWYWNSTGFVSFLMDNQNLFANIGKTMVVKENLENQAFKASAAIVLTQLSWNAHCSAKEILMIFQQYTYQNQFYPMELWGMHVLLCVAFWWFGTCKYQRTSRHNDGQICVQYIYRTQPKGRVYLVNCSIDFGNMIWAVSTCGLNIWHFRNISPKDLQTRLWHGAPCLYIISHTLNSLFMKKLEQHVIEQPGKYGFSWFVSKCKGNHCNPNKFWSYLARLALSSLLYIYNGSSRSIYL